MALTPAQAKVDTLGLPKRIMVSPDGKTGNLLRMPDGGLGVLVTDGLPKKAELDVWAKVKLAGDAASAIYEAGSGAVFYELPFTNLNERQMIQALSAFMENVRGIPMQLERVPFKVAWRYDQTYHGVRKAPAPAFFVDDPVLA